MVFVAVLLGAAVLCCSVLLVFGCVCHLFKKGHGFTNFDNDVESGNNVSMRSTNGSTQDLSNVTFEPLPDILAKTVSSRALRPRITCEETEKQESAAKLVKVYKPFPRNQLLYIKEIGLGWFGQVLQGDADNVLCDNRQTRVVVKILKDDANASEKALFLQEIAPYRELEYPHILQLLGQCTETSPYLAILEYPPLGDLKSYLMANKTGPSIQFAIDAAKGLVAMHKHSYIHHDFAARNCQLMADLTVKIGDYGIGEDLFREDYYDTGRDLLPIRWMSPESLELKQGIWQTRAFTCQSNVWSLSVLLWEILTLGRKPFNHLRDEDVLLKVVREGSVKLPPPNTDVPLHDRWYEIMEMCWQEADDRPAAEDILAFLQQIAEEVTSQEVIQQSHDHSAPTDINNDQNDQTGSPSLQTDSKFVMTKNRSHSNQHVAEVLVHRVDESEKLGFDDDFSKEVAIKKNRTSQGFEDDFVAGSTLNDSDLPQNDSIIASGGNEAATDDEETPNGYKDMFAGDPHLLHPPVPVKMSTPSKPAHSSAEANGQPPSSSNTADNQSASKYITAEDGTTTANGWNSNLVKSNDQSGYSYNKESGRSDKTAGKQSSKSLFDDKSESNTNDEGYRTAENGSGIPDILLSPQTINDDDLVEKNSDEESEIETFKKMTKVSPNTDLETERAKEIYLSKGIGLPPSNIHKSRSLGTIPEDGIPSDTTSQTGVVFEDNDEQEELAGMNFEWDDYDGEVLVGRVRYASDESTSSSVRSPRHVEVEEWPFDQDSGSENHSRPGSLASDSDAEVTGLSIGSNTSIDTRARIASILTNRLNSLIKSSNSTTPHTSTSSYTSSPYSSPYTSSSLTSSMTSRHTRQTPKHSLYSFSDYDNDIEPDSPEKASTDTGYTESQAPVDADVAGAPRESEMAEQEEREITDEEQLDFHDQDDHLIQSDLDSIAEAVLKKNGPTPEVTVSSPSDHMLPGSTSDSMA